MCGRRFCRPRFRTLSTIGWIGSALNTRLLKTMGCLVASMMGATTFLTWAKPSVERRQRDFLEREWNDAARAVVASSPTPALSMCAAIEVVAVPLGAGLSAPAPPNGPPGLAHFVVDENGRLATPWTGNPSATVPIDASTVRINVVQSPQAGRMTIKQWLGVQALIRAVHEHARGSSHDLPVRISLPRHTSAAEPHARRT
ncbi:MAG: hypothetical protein C4547_10370 [Phycisphaerales bacterium]|nr:MAG: hypothetical protein C4547_10370 [Phycisphaerales bacterium]